MNAILEYPLDALAFDYLSFCFFTVIITAAVGFWRIISYSTLSAPEPRGHFSSHAPPRPTASSSQVERLLSTHQIFSMSKETSSTATTTFISSDDAAFLVKEEGTKGKLTVYFKQDEGGECNGDQEEGEDDYVELSNKEWFENWEKLLKMRKGEMRWYCYQDMKVIDGSVVRLWDCSRRPRKVEKTAFSVGVVSAW